MEVNGKVIQGDCLEVLREMPSNSVDSVVTDPPYGLSKEPNITEVLTKWVAGEPYDHGHGGFMGKSWDSFVPHPDVWKEVYRVLKPGGHALVFAGTRTQDLMTIALRLGGFEIRDVIEWLYFSGFPKSMDVGKAFDKRRDDKDRIRIVCRFIRAAMDAQGLKSRELTQHFGDCNPRLIDHWAARDTDSQPSAPTIEQYLKLKEVLRLTYEMDELVYELNGRKGSLGEAWAEREKIGEKTVVGEEGSAGGYQNGIASLRGVANVKRTVDITSAATELARQWDGWGTAIKPAHEPIVVARKPLAGTVAETVEKYGTGAINIDGCRIGRVEGDRTEYGVSGDEPSDVTAGIYGKFAERVAYTPHDAGRFPANCITTDDDAFYSPYFNVTPREVCKKASKADRGVGNTHPTVKPTDLMAWLVRLVTPPGGTVLDPRLRIYRN
ncbi:DNA methyltransferase [Paenibacillus polymyxa]|uniref:DNA methyltransferase n=1 Tax=Paenibacillus polymyxa TaxID=1406 RepID=UPI000A7EB810|nr:DNA methyltransferase [Paenibacillus polymyxa]